MAKRPKRSDPLLIRKPVKHLKVLLTQNIERAVWMSSPLLSRCMSTGGRGGWVGAVSLYIRFVDSEEEGLYTEPSIVYDDFDLSVAVPGLPDAGRKNILDELD